ncbi:unnamed protein product, partial [Mesorhabditis spiculigera]
MLCRVLRLAHQRFFATRLPTSKKPTTAKKPTKRKKTQINALSPNVHQKLREWAVLFKTDCDAEAEQFHTALQSGSEGIEVLEARGHLISGIQKEYERNTAQQGLLCAFALRNNVSPNAQRCLKPGSPVSLYKGNGFGAVAADATVRNIDVENRTLLLKILRPPGGQQISIDSREQYSVALSHTRGTYRSMLDYLEFREKNMTDSAPGDHIISKIFRDKAFAIVQNDPKRISKTDCDESQLRALRAGMNAKREFISIQGPPGTGKTKVIAELIRLHTEKKKRVLVCAQSHAAVDNVFEKVRDKSVALRLRTDGSTPEAVLQHRGYAEIEDIYRRADTDKMSEADRRLWRKRGRAMEREITREVYQQHLAMFCTVTSRLSWCLEKEYDWRPDVLIIDEAAQCLEPMTWIPIVHAPRVILVGDHQQIGPLIFSKEAYEAKLGVSLMERVTREFQHANINFMLNTQYRMNEKIMSWSNKTFYNGELLSGEKNRDISISDISAVKPTSVFSSPLLMLDTATMNAKEQQNKSNYSFYNEAEVKVIAYYVQKLLGAGVPASQIGVITPYFQQVSRLRNIFSHEKEITVDTVDSFQGQERDVIVFSMVRDNYRGELGFLNQYRRMNVAVTRARRQFVLVGNSRMLEKDATLNSLRQTIEDEGHLLDAKIIQKLANIIDVPATHDVWVAPKKRFRKVK